MLLYNSTLVTFDEKNRIINNGAVRYTSGIIDAVGETDALLAQYPDEERWNANGLLLMPGQICAHTHFYGALARGMPIPGEPAKNFPQILQKLWWKLDKALDLEGVQYSAEVCLIDAIRNGTTTLIDHHASQNAIDGSLDVIGAAVNQSGLRGVLCYEVSDRDGKDTAHAGIRENVRFLKEVMAGNVGNRLAGIFGLHASMTLSDQTLALCRAEAESLGAGYHIHVAEDEADSRDSQEKYQLQVANRLHRFGITGANSIFAHCIHIDDAEFRLLAETNTWISHQPRSNMNNAVGAARIPEMLDAAMPVCLGNDGFSNDMFAEMKVADLLHKITKGDPRTLGADKVVEMAVGNNRALAQRFFRRAIGIIAPGAFADLILLDYYPTTPLNADNLPWHVLFGICGSHVHSTIVEGKTLMKNRELLTLDESETTARSREVAGRTWERFWVL